MKTLVPDYYRDFHCIAEKCRHSCCIGWEIDVDEDSLPRFLSDPLIAPHIDLTDTPHIRLGEGERCPFLKQDGLCEMFDRCGEDSLCQICRDHPRFRNYWTGIEEIGLGMVCEEAARIMLSRETPMKLILLEDDGEDEPLPEDEKWLWERREELWHDIDETGPRARLYEYLIYRHLPNALYDGMVDERIRLIDDSYRELTDAWEKTDGSVDALAEIVRVWSYDVEYDDEVIEKRLHEYLEEKMKNIRKGETHG